MGTHNSNPLAEARHFMHGRLDEFKTGMHRVVDRITTRTDGSPSRFTRLSTRASDAIKGHPYIALGAALALGYAIVRIVRR